MQLFERQRLGIERLLHGGGLGLESSALYAAFDEVPPIAGAFTYGEVGRSTRPEGDLNHAIVVATLA